MHTELLNTQSRISDNEMVKLRDSFVSSYCSTKAWDKRNLSFEQVLEIRSHSEWKNPLLLRS